MDCVLEQLERSTSDRSVLLNAILYIFQFDAGKTFEYIERIIQIFGHLLEEPPGDPQSDSYLPPDSVFHVLRSIVLQVKIAIQPFAPKLVSMVSPFLRKGSLTFAGVHTMSAIVFALKSTFAPFAIETFSLCVSLLDEATRDSECVLYLLQILTHLVIFCHGSHRLFLRQIIKEANDAKSVLTFYCLTFLSQGIANNAHDCLLLPALHLALSDVNSRESSIRLAARTLLELLSTKIPDHVPEEYRNPPPPIQVSADPFSGRSPPPIRPRPISNFLATLRTDEDRETLLLRICPGPCSLLELPSDPRLPSSPRQYPGPGRPVFPVHPALRDRHSPRSSR
jgi:hypothetical protein